MTNRQKLEALPTREFTKRFRELYNHLFSAYIDYEAYFDSEDEDITHFVKGKYKCRLKPPEIDLKNNSAAKTVYVSKYEQSHGRYILLYETEYFGTEYGVVADIKNTCYIKTPMRNIERESA